MLAKVELWRLVRRGRASGRQVILFLVSSVTKATAVAPAVKWHDGELTWKAQKIGYFHFIDYKHKEPEDGRWRWGDGVSELLEDMRRRYPTPLCFTVSPWRPFLSECTLADFPSAAG